MAILTVDEAKAAARVDGDDESMLIQSFADAAETWIERVTGKTFDPAPEDVKQAARLLVAYWYDQRHAATEEARTAVPYGVQAMLATRRSFAHGYTEPVAPVEAP